MIKLDAETEQRLADLAAIHNISVEQLIANFALDEKAALQAGIDKAIQQVENGEVTRLRTKKERDAHFAGLRDRAFETLNG